MASTDLQKLQPYRGYVFEDIAGREKGVVVRLEEGGGGWWGRGVVEMGVEEEGEMVGDEGGATI